MNDLGSASAIVDYFFISDDEGSDYSDNDDYGQYIDSEDELEAANKMKEGKEEEDPSQSLVISSAFNDSYLVINSLRASTDGLRNSTSSLRLSKGVKRTNPFECSICIEDFSEDIINLVQIRDCKHTFCKDCLSNYVAFKTGDIHCLYHKVTLATKEKENVLKIDDMNTYGIPCPARKCKHVMLVNELKPIATESTMEQFERFSRLHEENLQMIVRRQDEIQARRNEQRSREVCYGCGHNELKPIRRNRLRCERCWSPCCRECFRPHPPSMKCDEFDSYLRRKREEAEKERQIRTVFVKEKMNQCPRCTYMVIKNGGCNHMTCRCGQYFCNICGAALPQQNYSEHFTGCSTFSETCKGRNDHAEIKVRVKPRTIQI